MSLKIAYCIPAIYTIGGMERTLTVKANYFADKLNYKVYIILTDGKDLKPAFTLSEKIEVINLDINYDKIRGYSLPVKLCVYSFKQWLFRGRLTKTLNIIKPDITISMLRRDINFITRIMDGSIKIGEMHINRDNYRDFNTGGSAGKIKKLIAGFWMAQLIRNLRRLDKFVLLSYEDKQKWHELANVSVIYNPIARYPEVISDCSSKKVISAGRFENQKGFDMLIKSWSIVSKRYPDWNLEIYGSGDKSSYNKLVEENNIGNSCMLMEAVQNLNEKFTESSIFAFSSRFEGFGMVITEAMACGLPPVAFACPCGPRDIIEDGVNGLLAEPGNIEDLANKLSLLMEDSEMRKEMGKQARVRSERFSIEIIAVEWDELFHSLTEVKSNVRHSS